MYLMVIVGGAGNVKDGRLYEKGASSCGGKDMAHHVD